jgi:hypothetical protein
MAAEEGCVIACHTKEDFDSNFAKGKETGKLVRARDRFPIPSLLISFFLLISRDLGVLGYPRSVAITRQYS